MSSAAWRESGGGFERGRHYAATTRKARLVLTPTSSTWIFSSATPSTFSSRRRPNEAFAEQLLNQARRPAHDLHDAISGCGLGLLKGGREVGEEGEREPLVLFRRRPRRLVREDDRHLELVVAHVRVRIAHLERSSAHQDGAGPLDFRVHVWSARESLQGPDRAQRRRRSRRSRTRRATSSSLRPPSPSSRSLADIGRARTAAGRSALNG